MATDVFISYCRENAADADQICSFLERNGIECWIAPRNIPGGMEWPEAIAKGIQGSRVMLVLLSRHTERSKQIGRELTLAANKNLGVITVRLDDVEAPDSLQYFMSNLQWVDAFGSHFNEGLAKLLATLRYQLGQPQATVKPPPRGPRVTPKKGLSTGKKVAIGALFAFLALYAIGYRANHRTPRPEPRVRDDTVVEPAAAAPDRTEPATTPDRTEPATTAASFAQLTAGAWGGAYVCAGIVNQAQLFLTPDDGGAIHGILRFNAIPRPGAYYVRGKVNPVEQTVYLKFAGWQYRPPGDWIPLDVLGNVDTSNGTMTGRLDSPMCTGFELRRQ